MALKIQRGVSQSLYKYLPDSWVDFPVRDNGRQNYIAKVIRWNGDELDKVNKKRVIRIVNQRVKQFSDQIESLGSPSIQPAVGFGDGLNIDNCVVKVPKHDVDERGAVVALDPLAFFCPKCHKVHQYFDKADYDRHKGRCDNCHIEMKQIRLVYICKCGWSTSRQPIRCKYCGSTTDMHWSGNLNDYDFYCGKCHRKTPMLQKCKQCGTVLTPRPALDSSSYYPKSVDIIDIYDEKTEDFITNVDEGKYLAIAHWLGEIPHKTLSDMISKGTVFDKEAYDKSYQSAYENLKSVVGEEQAKVLATNIAQNAAGGDYQKVIIDAKVKLLPTTGDKYTQIAEQILEYISVQQMDDRVTIQDAANASQLLNTNAHPETFPDIVKKYGFSDVSAFGKIPFVTCAYGYTRRESEPKQGVQLHAFPEEKHGTKNVYAYPLTTEGVMFELDRVKILKWLEKNDFVELDPDLDLDDEQAVKLWFLNHIQADKITPFGTLNKVIDPETFYVYNLLHSISHVLIKSAAVKSGLSKDSLSEYIMPVMK